LRVLFTFAGRGGHLAGEIASLPDARHAVALIERLEPGV
jgi:hypothetical protein